jgi:ubiquitin carboxyl-terminal hydrolase 7
VVKRGEKFADTKKRLQTRLGVAEKDFAKYRFALIQASTFKQPSYVKDGASKDLALTMVSLLNLL